ncbi:aldehyde ferredoxin oxidoreductase C-terminal domain-containing protein [Oceanithermus sp.]
MKRRWLTVDLATGQVETRVVEPREVLRGGRWRTVRELLDRSAAGVDPLSPENPIIIATGPFAGSSFSSANRISIGFKSPLTGGVKESNSGGTLAYALGRLGIAGLTLLGAARGWVLLHVSEEGLRLESAEPYLGRGVYETAAMLREHYPAAVSIGLIGPVAEYGGLLGGFSITDSDFQPSRLSARGGTGAVFAAKRVKAIVVEGGETPEFARTPAFKRAMRDYAKALMSDDGVRRYTVVGTAGTADFENMLGGLPTKNFSRGRFAEKENPLGGEVMRRTILERGGQGATEHACMPGCVIKCSNKFPDASGRVIVSPLEYETLGVAGSNLCLKTLDEVAELNRLANDLGIDTIEWGATLGVAMDAGLGEWGSLEFVRRVADEMRRGSKEGRRYATGTARFGRAIGHDRVPVVRDQAMSAYDPRVVEGTGVTFMTSAQGADHTTGNVARLNPREKSLEELMELSFTAQVYMGLADALGLCAFGGSVNNVQKEAIMTAAGLAAGFEASAADFDRIGREVLAMELEFNRAAGLPDVMPLPRFMYEEPLPPRNLTSRLDPAALAGFWKRLER